MAEVALLEHLGAFKHSLGVHIAAIQQSFGLVGVKRPKCKCCSSCCWGLDFSPAADKGLAGAYNHNVFKLVEEQLEKPGTPLLFVVGVLGRQYFAKKGIPVEEQFHYTVQNPNMSRARIISEMILDYYLTGKLDEVHIIYTRMVNAMKMEAEMEQLLPLKRLSFSVPANVPLEEINLKPSADAVINSIVPIYCSGFIYGSLVESYSCEQNSRMLAMQTATDSAKKMLSELSIAYNRARQAAITQEITEVISGARAQKNKK